MRWRGRFRPAAVAEMTAPAIVSGVALSVASVLGGAPMPRRWEEETR
jgi:hypothetical protein